MNVQTCDAFEDIDSFKEETGLRLSRNMEHFFRTKCSIASAVHLRATYIAEDGVVIAMWLHEGGRYSVESYGTYVERRHRRRGLASLLWESASDRIVEGVSCSNDGFKFLSAMGKVNKKVRFHDIRGRLH